MAYHRCRPEPPLRDLVSHRIHRGDSLPFSGKRFRHIHFRQPHEMKTDTPQVSLS